MTEREFFKFAVMLNLVEQGATTAEQMLSRLESVDLEKPAGIMDKLLGGTFDLAKTLGGYAVPIGVLGPPAAGLAGGLAIAKATDVSDTDVEEAKQQEVIDELRRQTARLRGSRMIKRLTGKNVI